MDQNLSNLDLKLLTDSADTTLSGKLFNDGDDDDMTTNNLFTGNFLWLTMVC